MDRVFLVLKEISDCRKKLSSWVKKLRRFHCKEVKYALNNDFIPCFSPLATAKIEICIPPLAIAFSMLPTTHRPYYLQLKTQLEQLSQDLEAVAHQTSESIPLSTQVQQVQQYFQQQIMTLSMEEVDAAVVSQVQSYQTELHRYLRLLGTEVQFLAVSRNPSTTNSTLANLRDRVQKLIAGCDTLLGTQSESDNHD